VAAIGDRVVPSPLIVAQKMDKGAILMDTHSGECFELNAVGSCVWSGIERGDSFDVIAQDLATQYRIPSARARADMDSLVLELLRVGIVRPPEP
jgi:hypothetical protein